MYYISFDSMYKLQSKGLVMMSVSLCTRTGLHHLTIQVLNARVCYTSLTSVHNHLEHGLVNVTESFSPLDLNYTTAFVKAQTKIDVTSHVIPDTVYLPCTLNWAKLV